MKNLKRVLVGMTALGSFTVMLGTTMPQTKVIDYPIINFANTEVIDIQKVELTDSYTKLHVKAHFRPHYWIQIASDTYLNADGKKYVLTGAEDIELDSHFWMPDSGEADFTLTFEPLPLSTTKFDVIEGHETGAFKLWDVDISGKEVSEYPEELPSYLKIGTEDENIPDPAFEIGNTTVNFHLLPNVKELASAASLYVDGLDGSQTEYTVKFDEKGDASISFDQYGTSRAFLVDANSWNTLGSYTFFPGETVDCYVDMRVSGNRDMHHRSKEYQGKACRSIHNGKYRDFDRVKEKSDFDYGYYGFNLYDGEFADYHMTGEEYMGMVKGKYNALSDSISRLDAPQAVKEIKMLSLQNDVLEAIAKSRYLLEHNYRNVHDAWNERELPHDSIPGKFTDKDMAEVGTWFEIDNPKLLLEDKSLGLIDWNALGVKGDLSRSMNMFMNMASQAKQMKLTKEDLDELRTLPNPFFAAACDSMYQESKRALAQINSVESFRETPDVADEDIFDAIMTEHKGKVVIVDLWNTWCSPCRTAIKANEPLKDTELSDKDIVWIYIADETSDPNKYLEMIPNIRGIHYKLTRPQIEYIHNRFEVDGIPFYILLDREGNANGRPDIRDHSKYVKAIKELL